eukprot:g50024.t1
MYTAVDNEVMSPPASPGPGKPIGTPISPSLQEGSILLANGQEAHNGQSAPPMAHNRAHWLLGTTLAYTVWLACVRWFWMFFFPLPEEAEENVGEAAKALSLAQRMWLQIWLNSSLLGVSAFFIGIFGATRKMVFMNLSALCLGCYEAWRRRTVILPSWQPHQYRLAAFSWLTVLALYAFVVLFAFYRYAIARRVSSRKSKLVTVTSRKAADRPANLAMREPDGLPAVDVHSWRAFTAIETFWSTSLSDVDLIATARAGAAGNGEGEDSSEDRAGIEELYYQLSSKFVGDLSKAQFREIFRSSEATVLGPGECLFKEGQESDGMYVVVKGSLLLYKDMKGQPRESGPHSELIREQKETVQSEQQIQPPDLSKCTLLAKVGQGDCLGELDLLSGSKRRYTAISASRKTSVIRISKPVFEDFAGKYPLARISFYTTTFAPQWRVAEFTLAGFFGLQLDDQSNRYLVPGLKSWFTMEDECCKQISQEAQMVELSPGQDLPVGQGLLFIVTEGQLRVTYPRSECETGEAPVVEHVHAGAVVGGISFLEGTKPYSEATAVTQTRVACLNRAKHGQLLVQPKLLGALEASMAHMARTIHQFVELGLTTGWAPAGHVIFSQGQSSDRLFLIVTGRVRIVSGQQRDEKYCGRGEWIGEVSVLAAERGAPRATHNASAVCVRDCEFVTISHYAFELLASRHPQVLRQFCRVLAGRLQQSFKSLAPDPTRAQLFQTRGKCSTYALVPACSPKNLARFGSQLTSTLQSYGPAKLVTPKIVDKVLGPNTCASLNDYGKRSRLTAWIGDLEDTHSFLVFVIDQSASSWTRWCVRVADTLILVGDPSRAPNISDLERLIMWPHVDHFLTPGAAPVSQHPSPSTKQRQAVERADGSPQKRKRRNSLTSRLEQLGASVKKLSERIKEKMDASSGKGGKDNLKRGLLAHRDPSQLQLCNKILVLLHPEETALPQGTSAWLRDRKLDFFFHLKRGDRPGFARLARYLAGRDIGLVLSGGGARGLAHLGLFEAMLRENVPVDYVGGSSQGAFMAALFAQGPVTDEASLARLVSRTQVFAADMASILKLLADATFPIMSWFEGKKFGKSICEILGPNVQIEDLWIPFFAVTTNLTKADSMVHRTGPLWPAVRASMTVLGYLPPMHLDGCLLIDGGYTNNLPVDVCRDMFRPRYLICHDIETKNEDEFENVSNYGDSLNGWWLLYRRLGQLFYNAPSFKIPGYAEIIGSLIYINHCRAVRTFINTKLMDLYIRPDLGNTKMLDYHKMEDIVAIGLANARGPLRVFRAQHSRDMPPLDSSSKPALREYRRSRSDDMLKQAFPFPPRNVARSGSSSATTPTGWDDASDPLWLQQINDSTSSSVISGRTEFPLSDQPDKLTIRRRGQAKS